MRPLARIAYQMRTSATQGSTISAARCGRARPARGAGRDAVGAARPAPSAIARVSKRHFPFVLECAYGTKDHTFDPCKGMSLHRLKRAAIPLYVQIADLIRQRIARGQWPAGTRLPTLE